MPKAEKKSKPASKTAKTAGARMRKLTRKQTKAKHKKMAQTAPPLINSFRLTAQVAGIFRKFWKPLGGILFVYLILNVVFASGVSDLSSNVSNIKDDLNNSGVHSHPLLSGVSGFLSLVGSSGAVSSSTGSTLQYTLIVIESLVIIWALRHLLAGQLISVKQAYYSAMAPLIPFLLVVAFIFLQLLPMTFGSAALIAIASSLGTISGFWIFIFCLLFALLAAWSIYMISASIFAVYIVTLPDMKPRDALRSAKKLVRYRRW
ncbi:MAG TPA: hypothetical protein VG964_02215, partial [Candidatus Saccharimonadales bacterium]|nr:hypothetical protein [Candidatus Saccharimonadales bacterium]